MVLLTFLCPQLSRTVALLTEGASAGRGGSLDWAAPCAGRFLPGPRHSAGLSFWRGHRSGGVSEKACPLVARLLVAVTAVGVAPSAGRSHGCHGAILPVPRQLLRLQLQEGAGVDGELAEDCQQRLLWGSGQAQGVCSLPALPGPEVWEDTHAQPRRGMEDE